jgi:O-antigen ligase
LFLKNKRYFTIFITIILILFFLILSGLIDLSGSSLQRLQMGLQAVVGLNDSVQNAGSINYRQEMFSKTIDIIQNKYFTGIGAGLWGEYLNYDVTYPHNLFLEAFSELGVFFGALFLVPYLFFTFNTKNYFYMFPLFFLCSQQMSGDIADARWLLMFSLVVLFNRKVTRKSIANSTE